MYDIVIIGGGPAGLTAALYGARSGKSVLVIEKNVYGGQITWSDKLENFPGILSISGMEFADKLVEQVMQYNVKLELDEVSEVYTVKSEETPDKKYFVLRTVFGEEFKGKALIIATGAKPRMLGLENEENLIGEGISYCAVCDGEFYKGKKVAVVGGGNTALQEALYLSDLCETVALIHRREAFRGDKAFVKLLEKKKNVEFILNSTVKTLSGGDKLDSITLSDGRTIPLDGLFIAIGHVPDNDIVSDYIKLDDSGYAEADESCETGFPGIFAAGDCRTKELRQVTTAVADGTAAAVRACSYVDSY